MEDSQEGKNVFFNNKHILLHYFYNLKIHKQFMKLSIKKQTIQSKSRISRHFPKEDIQMAKKHMKRCSTLLTIGELQIKITMRYNLIAIRMVIIKRSTNNKCWNEYGEKGILLHCWWERKLVQLLWKTVWRFLRKIKIELTYDPANPLLRIYRQNYNSKRFLHPDVHNRVFSNTTVQKHQFFGPQRSL